MAEGDGGSIINVSTAGSLRPNANDLPYAMAKAALNALTLGLAGAWAPKVRANLVLPGAFDTDITDAWGEDMKAQAGAINPMGRIGQPDDLVGLCLFLASDASQLHQRRAGAGRRRHVPLALIDARGRQSQPVTASIVRRSTRGVTANRRQPSMKIRIDEELCSGHGRCYSLAPRRRSPPATTTASARSSATAPSPPELEAQRPKAAARLPRAGVLIDD